MFRGTVKDHQGYIDLQSEEGKGSRFTLYFPVTLEEPEKEGKTAAPLPNQGKGESILVVDDLKDQRELAMMMLEKPAIVIMRVMSLFFLKNLTRSIDRV